MKKIYLLFFLGIVGISSCTKQDTCNNSVSNTCQTQDLGVTTLNRLAFIKYYTDGNGITNVLNSEEYMWTWMKHNDTIEIMGINENIGYYVHYFFKNNNNCIDLLYSRNVHYDYQDKIIVNGEIIQSGYTVTDFYNKTLKIQEYIEDELLVGEIDGRKFWLEFTPDLEHPSQDYEYIQYFPDKVIYNIVN